MDHIAIVKRRSRLWPVVIALVVIALVALAAIWMMGDRSPAALRFGGGAPMLPSTHPAGAAASAFLA